MDYLESGVGGIVLNELGSVEASWIASLANWTSFWTLTFREFRYQDVCDQYFRRLVWILNKEAFGKNFNRWGHSYFSYVRGKELQVRGVWHFHVLSDRPVHYEFIHRWWNSACGFAWVEKVNALEGATKYVSKYARKGGEVEHYVREKFVSGRSVRMPNSQPAWWAE
jgi:hypothetical protein